MVSNKRRCVFGHQSEHLFRIPEAVRGKTLVDPRLYVPSDARCCTKHLKKEEWAQLAPSELRSYSPTQIEDMVDILRERGNRPPFLGFEFIEEMDDEVVREWTGLNRVQFQDLFLSVPSLSRERRPKTALGL
jgi:hypothetical protein